MPVGRGSTGVYQIRCSGNGKLYVGSASWCFLGRWGRHKSVLNRGVHHSIYLQRSWDKYGEDSFEFSVLERCTPEDCIHREQYWLDRKKSYFPAHGFNTCKVAGNTAGREVSPETREAIRNKLQGRTLPPEHRAKLGRKGWSHSEETKRKISESNVGKHCMAQESRKKMSLTKRKKSHIDQEIADWIRASCIPGHRKYSQHNIAKALGISRCAVQNVLNGVTWNDNRYPVNKVEAASVLTSVAGT